MLKTFIPGRIMLRRLSNYRVSIMAIQQFSATMAHGICLWIPHMVACMFAGPQHRLHVVFLPWWFECVHIRVKGKVTECLTFLGMLCHAMDHPSQLLLASEAFSPTVASLIHKPPIARPHCVQDRKSVV